MQKSRSLKTGSSNRKQLFGSQEGTVSRLYGGEGSPRYEVLVMVMGLALHHKPFLYYCPLHICHHCCQSFMDGKLAFLNHFMNLPDQCIQKQPEGPVQQYISSFPMEKCLRCVVCKRAYHKSCYQQRFVCSPMIFWSIEECECGLLPVLLWDVLSTSRTLQVDVWAAFLRENLDLPFPPCPWHNWNCIPIPAFWLAIDFTTYLSLLFNVWDDSLQSF